MTKQEAMIEAERDGIMLHSVYMRRLRDRRHAEGKTGEGLERTNQRHPDLKRLKGKQYNSSYMRWWREQKDAI